MADAAISRRAVLRAIPTVAAAAALPAAAEAAAPKSDKQQLKEHIDAIQVILRRMHPNADYVQAAYNVDQRGSGFVMATAIVTYIAFDGDGVYEVARGKTRPIYRVERAEQDGFPGYRVAHWWNKRRQGPWEFIHETDLHLTRKLSSL